MGLERAASCDRGRARRVHEGAGGPSLDPRRRCHVLHIPREAELVPLGPPREETPQEVPVGMPVGHRHQVRWDRSEVPTGDERKT
eukprot:scaffold358_cov343-Pavlova_lutheri.AAC.16